MSEDDLKPITVRVNLGSKMSTSFSAYEAVKDTFAVHRNLKWSYTRGEYVFDDRWQVTYLPQNAMLLKQAQTLASTIQAIFVAEKINGFVVPFEQFSSTYGQRIINDAVIEAVKSHSLVEPETSRYIVQRSDKKYAVVDSETDEEQETFTHRGMAAEAAKELNRSRSV